MRLLGFVILAASTLWCLLSLTTVLMSNADVNAFIVALVGAVPAGVGMLVGAILLTLGKKAGTRFTCSNCGVGIRKNATVCPGCSASLS